MNIAIARREGLRITLNLPETTKIGKLRSIIAQILCQETESFRLSSDCGEPKESQTLREIKPEFNIVTQQFLPIDNVLVFTTNPASQFCVAFKGGTFAGKIDSVVQFPELGEYAMELIFWGNCKNWHAPKHPPFRHITVFRQHEHFWLDTELLVEIRCFPKSQPLASDSHQRDIYFDYILANRTKLYDRSASLWFFTRKMRLAILQPQEILLKITGMRHHFILSVSESEIIESVISAISEKSKNLSVGIRLWYKGEMLKAENTVKCYKLKTMTECTVVYPDSYLLTLLDLYGKSHIVTLDNDANAYQLIRIAKYLTEKWWSIHTLLYRNSPLSDFQSLASYHIPNESTLTVLKYSDRLITIKGCEAPMTYSVAIKGSEKYISNLKELIQSTFQIPVETQRFYFVNELENKLMLSDYDIENDTEMVLLANHIDDVLSDINVYIHFVNKSVKEISINKSATVKSLKVAIGKECNILRTDGSRLISLGKLLSDDLVLHEEGVANFSLLYFVSSEETLIYAKVSPTLILAFPILPGDTVSSIKEMIEQMTSLPSSDMSLCKSDRILMPDSLLFDCGFQNEETIDVRFSEPLKLVIYPINKKPFSLGANHSDSLLSLKLSIQSKISTPVDQQLLIYNDTPLEVNQSLSHFRLSSGDSLHLVDTNSMHISVRTPLRTTFNFYLHPRNTIKKVKQLLHRRLPTLPVRQLRLYLQAELRDYFPLRPFERSLQLLTSDRSQVT